jgi:hypothetical protein
MLALPQLPLAGAGLVVQLQARQELLEQQAHLSLAAKAAGVAQGALLLQAVQAARVDFPEVVAAAVVLD